MWALFLLYSNNSATMTHKQLTSFQSVMFHQVHFKRFALWDVGIFGYVCGSCVFFLFCKINACIVFFSLKIFRDFTRLVQFKYRRCVYINVHLIIFADQCCNCNLNVENDKNLLPGYPAFVL